MSTGTIVKFSGTLSKTDPISVPVLIVGQEKHLSKVPYSAVKCKLEPRVNEQVRINCGQPLWTFNTTACNIRMFQTFNSALSVLNPCPTDTCPLFLNTATLAAISNNRSRHNSPAQPHMLTKLISLNSAGYDECIVVCVLTINCFILQVPRYLVLKLNKLYRLFVSEEMCSLLVVLPLEHFTIIVAKLKCMLVN